MRIRRHILGIASLSTVLALSVALIVNSNKASKEANAYSTSSLPTDIYLDDCDESDIRDYYSNLNSLSASERQGTNLLKNLKNILKKDQKYLSYDSGSSIWDVYCIVDRDWNKSPASELPAAAGTYNPSTNMITNYHWGGNSARYENPYLHALYYNRENEPVAQAYGDHGNGVNNPTGINREHIWPKGAGFETESSGGARGDIMHLWAAHGHTNNKHSNYYYGYVDTTRTYQDEATDTPECAGNLKGFSKTLGGGTSVFEPQRCDKGDIARACFYMAARYNYYSGQDSDGINSNNPNLELVNELSSWQQKGYASTTTSTGKLGIIQDLLEWNRLDPPDEFEIHRNNLCYRNFTNNRNPFIDFPSWADAIWGTVDEYGNYDDTPSGSASPLSDSISTFNPVNTFGISNTSLDLRVGETTTISANNAESSISWSIGDDTVIDIDKTVTFNDEQVTITALKKGTTTLTATSGTKSVTCEITVDDAILTLDKDDVELEEGQSIKIIPTLSPNNPDAIFTWESSDEDVAVVNNGVVTALKEGAAIITVTSNKGGSDQCEITVSEIKGQESFETADSIRAGDIVYLTAMDAEMQYTGPSTTSTIYGIGAAYDNGVPDLNKTSFTVCEGSEDDTYAFKLNTGDDDAYLSWLSGNSLRTSADIDANSSWKVTFDSENNATIKNAADETRVIWWNVSSPRFACYTGKYAGTGYYSTQLWKYDSGKPTPEQLLAHTSPVKALTADETVASPNSITDSLVFADLGLNYNTEIIDYAFGDVCFTGQDTPESKTPQYMRSDQCFWAYAHSYLNIYSDYTNISSIEITFTEGSYADLQLHSDWGTLGANGWIGDATFVSFKCLNTVKISRIDITHSDIVSVSNAALRFGVSIPQVNWDKLAANYEIDGYGVMFAKKDTLINTYGKSSIKDAYNAGKNLAVVYKETKDAPTPNGYNYMFTAKINITSFDHSDVIYCAQPFIVIEDEYYFLSQMEASVSDYVYDEYYGSTNNTGLSKAALQILIGY